MPAFTSLGFSFMTASEPTSMPRAREGAVSVSRFTHRIWMVERGEDRPAKMADAISTTSPKLDRSRYTTDFLILLNRLRPSITAFLMVMKLSSTRIISAASLATSVPPMPMATPMSAAFREGASLTPSPVMEQILPWDWNACTICTLFSGDTRAKTR